MRQKRIIIMGAAGRDFHNFNVCFRDNPDYKVVAFTATQIPNIDDRKYPAALAGELYPDGISIQAESELARIIHDHKIDEAVFAYSDVNHQYVMHKASEVMAAGADFRMIGYNASTIASCKTVISVCAVRTGCGKSQTTRKISNIIRAIGRTCAVIRHPMPYGNLIAQKVQRFAALSDLTDHHCTIEEMEEYEGHIQNGVIVYAGVDYEAILRQAEKEADVIIWDGGNNDLPFYKSDLEIVVVDPHRAGHETRYHPGETNFRRASVIVINKMDSADDKSVAALKHAISIHNPSAEIVEADSTIIVDKPELIRGKRVLVVEDGPTLTHGEMDFGAGTLAATQNGAKAQVDPRPFATGSIQKTFKKFPKITAILPAMGYGKTQIKELETTINQSDADSVIIGTPIDLGRIIHINKPIVRVSYELRERSPKLKTLIRHSIEKHEKQR